MLKQEGGDTPSSSSYLTNTWPSWCDSCRSVPCSVYCRADSAYLCSPCDASIHSANSLARRHHRVPVLPAGLFLHPDINVPIPTIQHHENDDDEDVDEYLDLVDFEEKKSKVKGGVVSESVDGVVPVGEDEGREMVQSFRDQIGFEEGFVDGAGGGDLDYNTSTAASSIGHNSLLLRQVSLSSMETAGVTESPMIDISSSHGMTSNGIIEVFSGPPLQTPHQFSPMDREARVLRYREKKKTRKFQKIIRYASRKAYAETRPRIKGRFAKRTEVGDQMFDAPVMVETGYGVVPSY